MWKESDPGELAGNGYRLRPESAADYPFPESLYVSIRWSELSASHWAETEKLAFLRNRFALQSRRYRSYSPGAGFAVLEHAGAPIGRICLYRSSADYRVMDISLVAGFRNRGLGTTLLQAVIEEARETGAGTSIHVEKQNPAQRLYRRLGFREVGEHGPYGLMVRGCEAGRHGGATA